MLKFDDIHKSYGSQVLFNGVSFSINAQERIGLVGRNGHGKTTLFSMILGEAEPDAGTISMPRYYRIGHLSQHIHFTKPTVLEEACLGLSKEDEHESWKVEKILFGLGFTQEDMEKPPTVFSGGYQIRLNLAKVLVSEPNLLLLDEPNNYLDIVAIRWLEGFLRSWKGELMLITHDRAFMDSVTTHTVAIHRQKARKVEGPTQKLYDQIELEEDIYEKTRLNEEKERKKQEIFIARFRAKARFGTTVQSRIKQMEKRGRKEELKKIEELEFSFHGAHFPGDKMASVHNIRFSYTGEEPYLIDDFSLEIGKNERICVIGRNGRGKTTLLRLMAGELAPLHGYVRKHPVLQTGYFGQTNRLELDENRTVLEEILASDPQCSQQRARTIAGGLMFTEDAALKSIAVLSGGEKNRVLLAKLLVKPCHALFMDEPTNHLDMQSCDMLLEALEAFDGSAIIVTHNEMFLHRLATKLVIFDGGKISIFPGGYRDFLESVGWKDEGKPEGKKNKGGRGRDELKKARAQLRQERSDTLKPLEEKLKAAEARISEAEKELHAATQSLVQASGRGDAPAIAEYSKKTHLLKQEIEALYDSRDKLTGDVDQKKAEFEKKESELS